MNEKLKFYCNSNIDKPWCDFKKIQSQLRKLQDVGIEIEFVDTCSFTEKQLFEVYSEAFDRSFRSHIQISQVFGSRNRKGAFFGREQPALFVYGGDSKYPSDVYPHDEKGKRILVEEYLEKRIKEVKEEILKKGRE